MKITKLAIIAALVLAVFATPAAADVVSVDNLNYEGNVEGFQGNVFTAYFINDDTTDDLTAYLSPQQLSDAAGEGSEVSQSVEISAEQQNFEARYDVNKITDRTPIYKLDLVHSPWYADKEDARMWGARNCIDADGSGSIKMQFESKVSLNIYDWRATCLTPEDGSGKWVVHSLEDNADTVFETKFGVQADGKQEETATVSNAEIGQGVRTDLGENTAIKWQGNLDTGQNPPGTSNYLAIKNRNSGDWKIITESSYENYVNYLDQAPSKLDLHGNCHDGVLGDGTCLPKDVIESTLDNNYAQATTEATGTPLTDNGEFRDGQYVKELDYNTGYPSFLVYIDGAEYVNVEKNAGEPEILDVESPDQNNPMSEGQTYRTGEVNVEVRNTGEAEGQFRSRIQQCGGQFSPTGSADTKQVQPGAIVEFTHTVTFSSGTEFDEDFVNSCNVQVSDLNSGESVTTDFEVAANAVQDCRPGSWFKEVGENETQLYQWGNDCETQIEKGTCDLDDEYAQRQSDGSLACIEGDSGGDPPTKDDCTEDVFGTGLITYQDPVCEGINNATGGFFNATTGEAFKWLLALGGFLVGVGLGRGKFAEFARIENEQTATLAGVGLGVLIAIVVVGLWGMLVSFITNPIVLLLLIVGGAALAYFGSFLSPLLALLPSLSGGDD